MYIFQDLDGNLDLVYSVSTGDFDCDVIYNVCFAVGIIHSTDITSAVVKCRAGSGVDVPSV